MTSVDAAIRTKRNGMRWVNVSTFVYSTDTQETVLVHLFRDATRKKQRELFIQDLRGSIESLQLERQATVTRQSPSLHRETLTPRESEVLTLLVRGQTTREIAQTLVISEATTRNHIRHVLGKLNVHSRLEAVTCAIQRGMVKVANL